jgi:hypothetical protein
VVALNRWAGPHLPPLTVGEGQGAPPWRAGLHTRPRVRVPPPQAEEQFDHGLQSDRAPATGAGATSQRGPVVPLAVSHTHAPVAG